MSSVSKTVKTLRKNRHLNQSEFGRLVGDIDQSTVSRWERGLQLPAGEALRRLAELAQVSPAELLDLEQSRSTKRLAQSVRRMANDKGPGDVKQTERRKQAGVAKGTIAPSGTTRRSPLFGCMKGTTIIMPGVDLTEPADPEWNRVYDDDYDHGVVLERDRKQE